MKKVFIISSILLGIVLLFLGVYNFAFKENSPAEMQQAEETKPAVQETVKKPEKLVVISDEALLGPAVDKKNETITYYARENGTVWKIGLDGGKKQQVASTELNGLKNVLWSIDQSKVLTTLEKNGQSTFYEYDYQTKKGTQLKSGLDTAVWDNLGAKIFYKYYDSATQKRSINIANPDGSNWQKIADTEFRNVSIAPVPLTSVVSFWNIPNANEETQLSTTGASGGEPQIILKGRYGADYLWSPGGTQSLVSSLANKDNRMTTLGIVTLKGAYSDLGIPTFVSKCAWSMDGKTVYYALPGDIPDGAVIPNDYQDKKFFTDDTFWKIDTTTNKKERIIDASNIAGKHDSSNLFLSPTEDALYFINRVDGKLYKIEF